jgi:hypothetical protein
MTGLHCIGSMNDGAMRFAFFGPAYRLEHVIHLPKDALPE